MIIESWDKEDRCQRHRQQGHCQEESIKVGQEEEAHSSLHHRLHPPSRGRYLGHGWLCKWLTHTLWHRLWWWVNDVKRRKSERGYQAITKRLSIYIYIFSGWGLSSLVPALLLVTLSRGTTHFFTFLYRSITVNFQFC